MPIGFVDDFRAIFGADTTEFNKALKKIETNTEKTMKKASSVVNTSAVAFAGLASAITFTTLQFAKYEKGLIAVQKTSNLTDKETEKLADDLIEISKKAPLAVDALLEIAEAAGQVGIVGQENIVKFTDTIAKLGATTDISGGQAAKTLARILNLTGENVGSVDRLGSAFVALGNDAKASESEIAEMALGIAKTTTIFDIGGANALGLSTSLAELAIQSERGSSVIGKAFIEIKNGIDAGGKSIERLSQVTGIAAEDLKGAFAEDATGVFVKFLESVKDVVKTGGNATKFLEEFELKGAGVNKVIAPLALNVDSLKTRLSQSNAEFQNATALEIEFAKASESVAAQLKVSQNKLDDAARTLGEKFAPVVIAVTTNISDFIDRFSQLDDETISFVANLTITVTAITGLTLVLGLAIKAALALKLALIAIHRTTGPLGLALTAIGLIATALVSIPSKSKKAADGLKNFGDKFNAFVSDTQKARQKLAEDDLSNLRRNAELTIKVQKNVIQEKETLEIDHKKTLDKIKTATEKELKKIESDKLKRLVKLNELELDIFIGLAKDEIIFKKKQLGILSEIDLLEKQKTELLLKEHLSILEEENLRHIGLLIDANNDKLDNLLFNEEKINKEIVKDNEDKYESILLFAEEANKDLIKENKDTLETIGDDIALANESVVRDYEDASTQIGDSTAEFVIDVDDAAVDTALEKIQELEDAVNRDLPSDTTPPTGETVGTGEFTEDITDTQRDQRQICADQGLAYTPKYNKCCPNNFVYNAATEECVPGPKLTNPNSNSSSPILTRSTQNQSVPQVSNSIAPQVSNSIATPNISNPQVQKINIPTQTQQNEESEQRIVLDVIISPEEMTNFVSAEQRKNTKTGVSHQ